ncbi:Bifunctional purine biosynthetic protein [Salix suchowensis]|nr:Bifunctional purine biosynthetic protein [Salix suchowensis]
MNGVRRFLGGTAVQLPQQPPEQEVPTAPLIIPLKGPSWPPQAGPQSSPATRRNGTDHRLAYRAKTFLEHLPWQAPASRLLHRHHVFPHSDDLQPLRSSSHRQYSIRAMNFLLVCWPVRPLWTAGNLPSWRRGSRGTEEAIDKKLALETKMRDAAISLSKVNSTREKTSKQTDDQLDAANTRLEAAQKEQRRISERTNEIHKKLMEHRAAVLSLSIRSMEKKAAPQQFNGSSDSGYDTPAPMSPTTSSMTGVSSSSKSRGRFDGAHYFAGHADAVVPRRRLSLTTAATEISTLEDKLKAATASLNAASKKQAEMARDLSLLRLEKQEVEMNMGLELQGAEETIASLQQELPTKEQQLKELLSEREAWAKERTALQSNSKEADVLRANWQSLS